MPFLFVNEEVAPYDQRVRRDRPRRQNQLFATLHKYLLPEDMFFLMGIRKAPWVCHGTYVYPPPDRSLGALLGTLFPSTRTEPQ